MINRKDKQSIKIVSGEFVMSYHKRRGGFLIIRHDWEILKNMIKKSIEPTNWYDRLVGFCFAATLFFASLYFTLSSYSTYFLIAGVSSLILLFVFIVVDSRERKFSKYNKDQILEYANEIEVKEDEVGNTLTADYDKELEPWTATHKVENEQGVDYKEILLEGGLLKSLTFKVTTESPYWRAGFKLIAPNAPESVPKLLTNKSFLFHVGRNENGEYGLSIYHDGNSNTVINKRLNISNGQDISISVERNEKNQVNFFVNNSLEYDLRFNPELFKKVFLVAWGDGKDFEVVFSDIAYSTV